MVEKITIRKCCWICKFYKPILGTCEIDGKKTNPFFFCDNFEVEPMFVADIDKMIKIKPYPKLLEIKITGVRDIRIDEGEQIIQIPGLIEIFTNYGWYKILLEKEDGK